MGMREVEISLGNMERLSPFENLFYDQVMDVSSICLLE